MNTFVKHILAVKISAITIGTAMYLTYEHRTPIERGLDTVLYQKNVIEEGFFKDPNGIGIERTINEHGKREVYVIHAPSGLKYGLGEDGYPQYSIVLERMKHEISGENISNSQAQRYLGQIQQLEFLLQEQLKKENNTTAKSAYSKEGK